MLNYYYLATLNRSGQEVRKLSENLKPSSTILMKMKNIRKDFPVIRERVIRGNTYYILDCRKKSYQGKQSESFTTKGAALERAKEISSLTSDYGAKAASVSGQERQMLVRLKEKLLPYNVDIDYVVNEWLDNHQSTGVFSDTKSVLDQWLKDKNNNVLQPLRKKTIDQIITTKNHLEKHFGNKIINTINKEDIENCLKSINVSNNSRKIYYKMFKQFFTYATNKKILKNNPSIGIKINSDESFGVKVLSFEQVKTLLTTVYQKEKDLIPYFAIALFAGIRPSEIDHLTYNDINFNSNTITVTRTKTKKSRYVNMTDNLIRCLKPFKNSHTFVKPKKNFRRKFKGIIKQSKIVWVKDILRHTAASFMVPMYKNDIFKVCEQLGNTPSILNRHYHQGIPPDEVSRFWNYSIEYIINEETLKKFL